MLSKIEKLIENYQRKIISGSLKCKASVLIPLFEKGPELFLLLTKRTQNVDVHKGQFSFPGGRFEKSDRDLRETALREANEEIGVSPGSVKIVGCLDDLETVTNYLVTPYVGILKGNRDYKLNASEIERVIEVPFSFFLKESSWREEEYKHGGKIYRGQYCIYEGDKIWGVTGKILQRFVGLILEAG